MRITHNAKIFRGQLDVAPFAAIFFLLVMFLLLQSSLVFTPGIPIQLPDTADLPGLDEPTVAVAVDSGGVIYFQNRIVTESLLREQLADLAGSAREPLTLVIQADKQVRYEVLVRLGMLARDVGIPQALLATRPTLVPTPKTGGNP